MVRLIIAVVMTVPCAILLLPVFFVTAVLQLFASCARAIGRLIEPRFVPWSELMTFDGTLGWKPRPHLDAHYLAEHDDVFRMVTDGEGWPGARSLDESRVVVIGDSFASGYGVDANKSFAEVDPALRIKAIGAPGYSMVQGVLLMEQLERRLTGKLVVWFAYLENDLQDNLAPEMRGYRAPFVRAVPGGGWEIVGRHLEPAKWRCSNMDIRRLFPRICVPGALADRAFSACDYLIERGQAACSRLGARLVVVSIPHPMQLTPSGVAELASLSGDPEHCDEGLPDRRLAECCRRHGVPMVAALPHLSRRDYKRREGIHWNERGHRRMAGLLRELEASFGARAPFGVAGPVTHSHRPAPSPAAEGSV